MKTLKQVDNHNHTDFLVSENIYDERVANRLFNKTERQEFPEYLESSPVSVIIPTGMRCNSRCVFCTDRNKGTHFIYEDLTFDEFLNFSTVAGCASHIGLYAWGEPLVNPDYRRMYEYATRAFYGAYLTITTNGILFDVDWAERVINYPWSAVTFSVNAATPSTYKKLTSVDKFGRVIDNIRQLTDARKNCGKKNPHVSLSFVALTENIRELPAFVELAGNLGAEQVILQDLIVLNKSQEHLSLKNNPQLANSVFIVAMRLAREKNIVLTPFVPTEYFPTDSDGTCWDPWESMKIALNGDVYLCCYSERVVGNVLEQTVEDIWNGRHYREFRRRTNSTHMPEECRICPKKTFHRNLVSETEVAVCDEDRLRATGVLPQTAPSPMTPSIVPGPMAAAMTGMRSYRGR